jgi:hypothetical protein
MVYFQSSQQIMLLEKMKEGEFFTKYLLSGHVSEGFSPLGVKYQSWEALRAAALVEDIIL